MQLPTSKTSPTVTPATANMLIYGQPGIGKTTLASQIHPDTVILATEPGTGGLEAYVQTISTWDEFIAVAGLLVKGDHQFKHVAIDTADELQRMCQEHVVKQLGVDHPGDLEYGKGWDALSREWRRIAGFCQAFNGGVMFTSHAKEVEVELPVGKINRAIPTLTGSAAKWLLGYVEFIFYADMLSDAEGSEVRVLRTQPSKKWIAKARTVRPMPATVALDAKELRAAMFAATKPAGKKPAAKKPVPEPAAA